jgi:hypothetical protein
MKENFDTLGHPANLMGETLRKEVERQLIEDLLEYNFDASSLKFNWSDVCQEGHCTSFLGGELEAMSSVALVDSFGNFIVEGWMDFIHGHETMPLHVFWLFLSIKEKTGEWKKIKKGINIPIHVWNNLSSVQKDLCTKSDEYDSTWADDPLVIEYKKQIKT